MNGLISLKILTRRGLGRYVKMQTMLCICVADLLVSGLFRLRKMVKESERVRRERGCEEHGGCYRKDDQDNQFDENLITIPSLEFVVMGKGHRRFTVMAMIVGGQLAGHQCAC
jgi:hypothetical protein